MAKCVDVYQIDIEELRECYAQLRSEGETIEYAIQWVRKDIELCGI